MTATVIRFWFGVGQADAWSGLWDCAPLTRDSLAERAYRQGQMVAAGTATRLDGSRRPSRFYRSNRALTSGKLFR